MEKKFAKYLTDFMEKKDYKLEYLAEKTGFSTGAIGHYKVGRRTPQDDFVEKFIKIMNISKVEAEHIRMCVAYDRGDKLLIDELEKIKSNVKLENTYELIEIPVYSSVSAGFGYVPEALPIEYVSIPKTEGDIVGIRVSGDSMEKTIYDGDIVIVKKDVEINIGDIGVFLLNREFGDGVVKRLAKKNGVFVLESDNPYYTPIEIKASEITTCGKVIKILKTNTDRRKDPFIELFNSLSADKQQDLLNYAEFLKNKK